MKVVIKETGKVEMLTLTDANGIDWTQDLIGNWGALSDGQFEADPENGAYICTQETYDWWDKLLTKQQALDDRVTELKEKYGVDKVEEALSTVDSNDLEDLVNAQIAALDEAFPEADEGN